MMSDHLQNPSLGYICQLHAEGDFTAIKPEYFISVSCFNQAIYNEPGAISAQNENSDFRVPGTSVQRGISSAPRTGPAEAGFPYSLSQQL